MNTDELRLFGSNMVIKSIEEYIDNHPDEFAELHSNFAHLTENNPDAVHWHSDIDIYVKSVRLSMGIPTDTFLATMYHAGQSQLEYIQEKTKSNNNQILMSLYSLQFLFEYGSQYFLNKKNNL